MTALAAAVLLAGLAQGMSERHRVWVEEEVAYVISDAERDAFLALEGEELRDAFVEAFWDRRDPDPLTPENEFREEHHARIDYANRFYGRDTGRAGWRTDRGRFHIVLGPPRIKDDLTWSNAIHPAELWFYNDAALLERGLPGFFYLLFFRRFGAGEMRLYSPVEDGPRALLIAPSPFVQGDFRRAEEIAFDALHEVSPELASASLSFRTDEGTNFGDVRGFGTLSLVEDIREAPWRRVDTSYAERFDLGVVESDYLFRHVPSAGFHHVLPGPGGYWTHWAIQLPPTSIMVVRDPDRGVHGADFIVSIEITSGDAVLYEDRSEAFFSVTEAEAAALSRPFRFRGAAPVIPGDHELRVVLRNRACLDAADCRRSYTLLDGALDVPELDFDTPALVQPALAHGSELLGGDPLYRGYRFGRRNLLPNPEGFYRSEDRLHVLAEPLNAPEGARIEWAIRSEDPDPPAPVRGSVPASVEREGPLVVSAPLADLPAGRYRVELALAGPSGEVLDRKSAPFAITPRADVGRPLVEAGLAELRPEIGGAHELARARQWEAAGDADRAFRLATEAVRAGANLVPAREFLAGLLLDRSDPAGAADLLEPVFEAHPDRFAAARLLGEARVSLGAFEGALAPLRRALELRAPDAELLVLLATAHLVLGDEAEANRFLDRAETLDPENDHVRALRGR